MNWKARPLSIATVVEVIVFATAFMVAPNSCEGGLEFYFCLGIVSLVVLITLPFVTEAYKSNLVRLAWAFMYFVFGAAVWLAGLFIANIRIMCRLF